MCPQAPTPPTQYIEVLIVVVYVAILPDSTCRKRPAVLFYDENFYPWDHNTSWDQNTSWDFTPEASANPFKKVYYYTCIIIKLTASKYC